MNSVSNSSLLGAKIPFPRSSYPISEWRLRAGWQVMLFLLPIVAVSAWLTRGVIRVAWFTYMADTVSIPDIQKALLADPGNPNLAHRLGTVYSSDPTEVNLSAAVSNLRKAVDLNPRRWDFWSDLGTTCDFAGDTACSDAAFARALALNPMAPALRWAMGNHYLLTNRLEQAFPCFRRLLEMEPRYLQATFRLCLRATRDPQAIYTQVLPQGKDAAARFAYLSFLGSTADYESAMRIWGQMISGHDRSPDLLLVEPFLDFLIDHNQVQDAGVVWHDLQHAGVIPPGSPAPDANLLYDGSFERPRLDTGFDWHQSHSPELEFDFADPSAYRGAKCLRIDFAVGRNADYDLLNQVVLIKPSTRYQLTSYVRSDNLTSESGPRWRVVQMGCDGCEVHASEPTVGTTPWHPLAVEFTTQPQTQAVRISFWRPQDQKFYGDITGTVWLDDVALRTLETPAHSASEARTR